MASFQEIATVIIYFNPPSLRLSDFDMYRSIAKHSLFALYQLG